MGSKLEIYGRDDCRYCAAAIAFATKRAVPFVYHDMTNDAALRAALTGRLGEEPKTVPQIFIGPHHIGGFDNLQSSYPVIQQILGG